MLRQHGIGLEHAGGIQRAFGDDALPFAEQVRQNSLVGDRQRGAAVGDAEIDSEIVAAHQRARLHQAAEAEPLPGGICFSAAIVGVEKNTMKSRIAFSTSAAAMASTASEPPIMVKRRCLRVISILCPPCRR